MAYITLAQSKQTLGTDLYVSAYDDVTNPGTPSDTALQEDIDFVTGVIDAALIQTFNTIAVPIVGVAALALLKGYAGYLLKYKAYSNFDDSEIPAVVVDKNREVETTLTDLSFLPGVTQDVLGGAISYSYNSATENSTANSTLFKRSEMRGM